MARAPTRKNARPGANIAEVATRAGVSKAAVSRVLNEGYASPSMQAKVRAAMDELDYSPSAAAMNFAAGRTGVIAVVANYIDSEWIPLVLRGIEKTLTQDRRASLLLGSLTHGEDYDPRVIRSWIDERRVDGAIFLRPRKSERPLIKAAQRQGIVCATVAPDIPFKDSFQLRSDNTQGGELLAKHLLSLGHQRFAYVGGEDTSRDSQERLEGLQAVLKHAKASLPAWDIVDGIFEPKHGRAYAKRWLKRKAEARPTAVVCADDTIAMGFIGTVLEAGSRNPDPARGVSHGFQRSPCPRVDLAWTNDRPTRFGDCGRASMPACSSSGLERRTLHGHERFFGGAELPDRRLVLRLVDMAAAVAARPGGTVTKVMRTAAQKEGAFRFLESGRVETSAVAEAMFESTARHCRSPTTYVALDQTSLTFTDTENAKGLGPDDARMCKTQRAIQSLGAYAMDADGVPIGLIEQQIWLRSEKNTTRYNSDTGKWVPLLPRKKRESIYWPKCLEAAKNRFERAGTSTRAWYLAARGADSNAFLASVCDSGGLFTLRSSINRVVEKEGLRRKLHSTVKRQKVLGHLKVVVPPGANRRGRVASLQLRQVRCLVRVTAHPGKERWEKLTCVQAREIGRVPSGEERIEWKLLTNYPVRNFQDGLKVIQSYTLRWRIEEFHKTWKSGACNVESSQLRSLDAIKRWAAILAAVAARIERLKRLSREQPNMPALTELSRHEVDAAIMLSETRKHNVGDELTLQQAVALIGILGGHMGRKSDGPPGSITIRRGLELVAPAAAVLQKTSG